MYVLWDFDVSIPDILEKLVTVLRFKRRMASDHFHDETTKAPPINGHPMPLLLNDLRGKVLWSAAHRHRRLIVLGEDLAEAKVRQFDVAFFVD